MSITSLSYSSACTLQACEQKYVYRKVLQTAVDFDAIIDKESFRFGKAFHKIMEDNKHKRIKILQRKLDTIIPEFDLTYADHAHVLYACCQAYWDLHEASELEVVGVEVPIETQNFVGFVDAVMKDKNGYWWIVDLKTSSYADTAMFKRLSFDPQLNLYVFHAQKVAEALGLNMDKFAGARYRTVQKPRLQLGKNETYETYSQRIQSKAFDIGIPKDCLSPVETMIQHNILLQRAITLSQGITPTKNRSNCYMYNTPCEYWSKCHGGMLFSEEETVKISDRSSMKPVIIEPSLEDIL